MAIPKPDMDEMTGIITLIGRMGAKSCQIGYFVEDPPPGAFNWYAEAEFRKGTLVTEPQAGPVEALRALAKTLRNGAKCAWCTKVISWGERRRGSCFWQKSAKGDWQRGCISTHAARLITEMP